MINRELYVSEEAYLKAKNSARERERQIVGYKVDGKFYKYSRNDYKYGGLVIIFASWILSHWNAPIGIILFGLGLYVYYSAPSSPGKRIYACDNVKWQGAYAVNDYNENECPSCGATVTMGHKLITKCSVCDLTMCKFGAELKTAKE